MKKKFLCIALSAVLAASLIGCGSGDGKKNETNNNPTEQANTPGGQTADTETPAAQPTNSAVDDPVDPPPEKKGDITYSISEKVLADEYIYTPVSIKLTDDMCEDAIINEGNCERLAAVMEKASAGQEITIAYIGGSITDGSLASPQDTNCYAALTQVWWEYTFQDAKINYINAGIGATDSYIGVHRAYQDVISKNPDLVVVEFSVNDTGNQNCKETYESLIRKLLKSSSQPAVVSLVLTMEKSFNSEHYQVAIQNDIPCISYAKVALDNMKTGVWNWSDIGSTDKVHPINEGHAVISHLLTYFYSKVLESINDSAYFKYELPEATATKSRYEDANIYYADSEGFTVVESENFDKTTVNSSLPNHNGWATTSKGSITFEAECNNIGIIFWGTTDGKSGQFDVYVNDEKKKTINADFTGQWGSYASYVEVSKFNTKEVRTIKIVPAEDSTGDNLAIIALAIS